MNQTTAKTTRKDSCGSGAFWCDRRKKPCVFPEDWERSSLAEQRRTGTFDNIYKFNAKELDSETGLYYYGARYYDPRISLFISVDPLTEQTMTPYQYTYQNPVRYIDPDGRAPVDIIYQFKSGSNTIYYEYKNGSFYNINTGKKVDYNDKTISDNHMYRTNVVLNQMAYGKDEVLKEQIKVLNDSERRHVIKNREFISKLGSVGWLNPKGSAKSLPNGYDECVPYETSINFDFRNTYMSMELYLMSDIMASFLTSDFELVSHEISHAFEADTGTYEPTNYKKGNKHNDPKEINATVNGNRARTQEGRPKKTTYGGKQIDSNKMEKAEKRSDY